MVFKRPDGRKPDEFRPISAKVGVIKNAKGSALFKIGTTMAYAAVYGPREIYPKFLADPKCGKLRCSYDMMPFSGQGERGKPGPNRRAKEISLITEKALTPVMDLTDFPNSVVDVYIELPQSDGGTRCAGICAASLALADAGFRMRDLPASIACGVVEGTVIVDLNYLEDSAEGGVDLPMTILPRTGEITHLQMDGITDKEVLKEAFKLGRKCAEKINKVMVEALKAKFAEE